MCVNSSEVAGISDRASGWWLTGFSRTVVGVTGFDVTFTELVFFNGAGREDVVC